MKEPGSPTSGLSSMYSLLYREERCRDCASSAVPRGSETGSLSEADRALVPLRDACVSGIGVLSMLVCVACRLVVVETDFGTGGMYVYPSAGVKMGSAAAVDSILVRDVTVESCPGQYMGFAVQADVQSPSCSQERYSVWEPW